MLDASSYAAAIANLRGLLRQLGRAEFRAYGYQRQLRRYRVCLRSAPDAAALEPRL